MVGTLGALDPDSGETFTFALVDDAAGRFAISGSDLVLAKAVDYETATSHTVTVRVTDSAGNTLERDLTIGVTDAAPGKPTDTNSQTNGVITGANAGTEVGITAHATDPNGGSVTYSLADDAGGRFAIDATTGVVTVANASLIDSSAAASHTITVKASDPSGAFDTQSLLDCRRSAAQQQANCGHAVGRDSRRGQPDRHRCRNARRRRSRFR